MLAKQKAVFSRFQPGIWVMTTVGLLNSMAIAMSLPFMALYLFEKRGVSMAMVGVIILTGGIGSGLGSLFGGSIADRLGRRRLLLISFTLVVIAFAATALLIGYLAPIFVIVIALTVGRAVLAMQRPAIQAVVVDLTPRERLAETYGFMRIGGNLGFAMGPAIGGFLAAYLSYAWLFGLAGLIMVVALAVVFFLFKETFTQSSEKVSIASVLAVGRDRNLVTFTLLSLLVFLVMGQLSSTLSVYSVSHAGFSTSGYGFLLTLNGAIIVVFQYPISRLLERAALYKSLMIGAFLYGAGYLLLAWVGSYGLAVTCIAIVTAGEITFAPTSSAVVGRMAAPQWAGRYMAFFGLSETLGWAMGPLIGGILLDRFASQPLLVWGPISLLGFAAVIGFQRWGSRH
jgi:predicted MFS family arabinose efflux permease